MSETECETCKGTASVYDPNQGRYRPCMNCFFRDGTHRPDLKKQERRFR